MNNFKYDIFSTKLCIDLFYSYNSYDTYYSFSRIIYVKSYLIHIKLNVLLADKSSVSHLYFSR